MQGFCYRSHGESQRFLTGNVFKVWLYVEVGLVAGLKVGSTVRVAVGIKVRVEV